MFLIWWLITSAVDWEHRKGRSAPWDHRVHSVSESDPKVLRNTKSRYWSALIFKTKSYTTEWSLVRQICLLHPMLWSVIWIVISTRRSGGVQNKMETTIFPHPCKMRVCSLNVLSLQHSLPSTNLPSLLHLIKNSTLKHVYINMSKMLAGGWVCWLVLYCHYSHEKLVIVWHYKMIPPEKKFGD